MHPTSIPARRATFMTVEMNVHFKSPLNGCTFSALDRASVTPIKPPDTGNSWECGMISVLSGEDLGNVFFAFSPPSHQLPVNQ